MMLLPALSLLAFAQEIPPVPLVPPPEPIRPPYHSCVVQLAGAIGEVEIVQFVLPDGTRNPAVASWEARREPEGIRLNLFWDADGPPGHGAFQIRYAGLAPGPVYRIRVQRHADDGDQLRLETGLRQPEDGALTIFGDWRSLAGFLTDATAPRLLVLDADGNVLRSDPVDPAAFGRVVEIAGSLRPELERLVADYRERCEFVESLDAP